MSARITEDFVRVIYTVQTQLAVTLVGVISDTEQLALSVTIRVQHDNKISVVIVVSCHMTTKVIVTDCFVTPNPGVDINECVNRGLCAENAFCENTAGSYTCNCNDGFEGDLCTDIDECNNTVICDEKAKCTNTLGGFSCQCKEGYYGNEKFCILGECVESNCPKNQQCVSPTTLTCECKKGFSYNDASVCVDIDECATEVCQELTETENTDTFCLNTIGSFTCSQAQERFLLI